MNKKLLMTVAKLRLSVGFLGESHQRDWWSSNFFSATSDAFLSPVFAKTPLLAKYYGVKAAAARVHDDHIGIGKGVYHLFRLPEMIEIDLHELFAEEIEAETVERLLSSPEAAEGFLFDNSNEFDISDTGPVWMGSSSAMTRQASWHKLASLYLKSFSAKTNIFPYFSGKE